MILHFGDKDQSIPLADIEKIKAARPEVPVYVYPGAGHGFNCDERGSFDAAAAELAGKRTMEFFSQHIRLNARSRIAATGTLRSRHPPVIWVL